MIAKANCLNNEGISILRDLGVKTYMFIPIFKCRSASANIDFKQVCNLVV